MPSYDIFARFYDETMGDRTATVGFLRGLIDKARPQGSNLLELACGTGELLEAFAEDYEVSGLDLSGGMLKVAKKKLPRANFYQQSMAGFELPESYDVILCVFDSVNHLLKFSDWKKLFKSASRHLNEGGVFIFDMNSLGKLEEIVTRPEAVYDCGTSKAIMGVDDVGRGVVSWNVKVFEQVKGDQYKLHEEEIREISFPEAKVRESLAPLFGKVRMISKGEGKGDEGDRLYFVCKK